MSPRDMLRSISLGSDGAEAIGSRYVANSAEDDSDRLAYVPRQPFSQRSSIDSEPLEPTRWQDYYRKEVLIKSATAQQQDDAGRKRGSVSRHLTY